MARVALGNEVNMPTVIRIADHARSPGGRYVTDGPFSGEWFRETVLIPVLRQAEQSREPVVVELDGTFGYGASFLEEAFGGLVRRRVFAPAKLRELLSIRAATPLFAPYKALADRYLRVAEQQSAA